MSTNIKIEDTTNFIPKFDANGLIPAISQDVETGQILMVAYMNQEALKITLETKRAVFFSRSRQKLWKKGEQSGHVQQVQEILIDCDQDCLILKVKVDQGQCHAGYQSCFYRQVNDDSTLTFTEEKVYDPEQVYKKK